MDDNKFWSPENWYDRAVAKTPYWSPLDEDTTPIGLAPSLPEGVKITAFGVVLPDDLDFDQWVAVGKALIAVERCVLWALAEWWAFGHHKYGARAFAAKKLGYDFGYLMNLGWVARSVSASSRNEALSFTHHMKVAKLNSEEQQKDWLEKAVENKWSANTLEQKIKDSEKGDDTGEDDPKVKSSHTRAVDAIHHFGKLETSDLQYYVNTITTDKQFRTELDERTLARLLSSTSCLANMLNDAVTALEKEQERRARHTDNQFEPNKARPDNTVADEAEEEAPKTNVEQERLTETEAKRDRRKTPVKREVGKKPVARKRQTKKAA